MSILITLAELISSKEPHGPTLKSSSELHPVTIIFSGLTHAGTSKTKCDTSHLEFELSNVYVILSLSDSLDISVFSRHPLPHMSFSVVVVISSLVVAVVVVLV